MAKKIYDVLPPKIANKVENTVKSLGVKNTKKRRVIKTVKYIKGELPPQAPQPNRRFPIMEILVGCIIVFFLFGIYFFNKLPKVDIEIFPELETITLQEKITANTSVDNVDLQKKIIPSEFLEEIQENSQEFPATGTTSNDGKSSGAITIYNKVSPAAPITLVAGTHFLSDSGKYFITLAKATIPAMKGKTPGSVNVKVQAEKVGSDYNIGPSKFSVPKLSGTSYYYSIYGESTEAMAGGYTGKVKKVTKDDLESAEDVLTKKLLENAESSLRNKISQDEILLEGAIASKVINASSDTKPETIADKFNQSAKVRVYALVIKRQDPEMFAKDNILSRLPDDKNLLLSSLTLDYNVDAVDFAGGIEKINLQASAKTYYTIDLDDLAELFKRKSSGEIKEIISSQYGQKVSEVKINFWPFWVKSAPKDMNRIKINLIFE